MSNPRHTNTGTIARIAVGVLTVAALTVGLFAASQATAAPTTEASNDTTPHVPNDTSGQDKKSGKYEELYPSGAKKIVGAYEDGQKTGQWLTYDESGSTLESATYVKGELSGPFTHYFPNGKPQTQITFRDGEITGPVTVLNEKGAVVRKFAYPKTKKSVTDAVSTLYPKERIAPTFVTEPKLDSPHSAGQLSPQTLDEALKVVKLYRFLCGVTWQNVTIDPQLCVKAQHASVLIHEMNALSHTPSKPADMSDAFFKTAYDGCHQSNLFMGHDTNVIDSIDGYMNDSDASNVAKVGHRQWILSPGLRKTGFGFADGFSAMHVLDGARKGAAFRFVAFPGEGYYPRMLVTPRHAWSVHLSPAVFQAPATGEAKVTLTRLDDAYASGEDVPVNIVSVLPPETVQWYTIIFQPQWQVIDEGKYWVNIDGLKATSGKPLPLGYIVDLYGDGTRPTALRPKVIRFNR